MPQLYPESQTTTSSNELTITLIGGYSLKFCKKKYLKLYLDTRQM